MRSIPQSVSRSGIDLIQRFEGCSLKAYLCPAGKMTIGYGHVLLPHQDYTLFPPMDWHTLRRIIEQCQRSNQLTDEARMRLTITLVQVEQLLANDLKQVALFIRSVTQVDLNQHQFDALASFIFNVGQGNYARSTLRKKLHAGDFSGAAIEFGRWVYATKNGKKVKLNGLIKRRAAEVRLFKGV